MKRMTLTNKTSYSLNDDQQAAITKALDAGTKYIVLNGDLIMVAAIIGIQDEAIFDEIDHAKNHDYKCVHGQWHGRDDKCYGHDALPTKVPESNRLKYDNRSEDEIFTAARLKSEEIRANLIKKMKM